MSHGISNSNINSAAAPKLTALKSKAQNHVAKVDSDDFGTKAPVSKGGFEGNFRGLDQNIIERKSLDLVRFQNATRELGPDLYQARNQATDGAPPPTLLSKPQRLARLSDENERYRGKTQEVSRTHFDAQV